MSSGEVATVGRLVTATGRGLVIGGFVGGALTVVADDVRELIAEPHADSSCS